jgi:hypothetical protein
VCSNSNFFQIQNSAKQTCSQLLDNFAVIGYSEAWGKLIHEKKPEVANLMALSL